MRKFLFTFFALSYSLHLNVFASDAWIFKKCTNITVSKLRTWDIHTEDIPCMIGSAINILMWIAGSVSIFFIIVWAYQMLLWSLEKDLTKWKNTIYFALMWFVISASSWLIIRFVFDNFSWV